MTKFNPENKEKLTYGEALSPAMGITDLEDAKQYKADYIAWQCKIGASRERAEEIVNTNLGYYAGYYDDETRKRVERLFICFHPIFGSIEEKGTPTTEEAFNLGKSLAVHTQAETDNWDQEMDN